MVGISRRASRRIFKAIALCLSSVSLSSLPATVQAQEENEQSPPKPEAGIPEIVVWGTAVRSDLLTIDQEEIAIRQADHLSDLLRIVPGVDIGGTHSVNSRINIRGLDDRELSIYVDGALQTNYLYHHIGNLLINPDILKSADIQVGSNTVAYGGIGGAVRFETKTAADLLETTDRNVGARLMGSYNSNAQYAASGTAYGQFSDYVDALVYYYWVDRDNFEDGSDRETIGSDGETDNLLAKIGLTPTDNQRLQISYDRLTDEGDYTQRPDMGVLTNQAITGDILLPTEYKRETINASYSLDLNEFFQLEATYYLHDLSLERDERNPGIPGPPSVLRTLKRAEADNSGANVLAISEVSTGPVEHQFKYGGEFFDQELTFFPDLVAGTPPTVQEAQTLAFFVENEFSFTDWLRIRPGVRYTDYEVEYLSTNESGSFDDFTFGVAGEIEPIDGLVFLASYTEIFQGPELAEPFIGAGGNKIVNPNLDAEEGHNVEVGFRFTREVGEVALGLGANAFKTTIDGYIGEVDVPGTTTGETQDDNLGTVVIKGIEASFNAGFKGLDLFLSHNIADFDTDELSTAVVSESFREVGDTTAYEISHSWDEIGFVVSLNGIFVAKKETSIGDEKASYNVHNIMARWDEPLGLPGASITAGIDNVLDRTYTSHASRLGSTFHPVFGALELDDVEPGRNFKVTLAATF